MIRLTEKQAEALTPFRLSPDSANSPLSIDVIDLLDPKKAGEYLAAVKEHIGAKDEKTAASILVKRYAFLPVIYLYSMTAWNLRLNISHENLSLEGQEKGELWLPAFRFKSLVGECAGADREQWREESIRALFSGHVFPILDNIAKEAKISKLILWENIAIYLFWLYETVLPGETSAAEQAAEDFKFIMEEASGDLFGGYNQNPLKRYHNEKIFVGSKGKLVRPRKTCCFSYLTDSGKRCGTCPQICKSL
ncbi:(2Fe-2S)-binding protein [Bacillus sp. ISL-47]|uniref:IucA/IucC family C-terminal-domain containing protein n=1 Tax=Bacillus sp. ISL-47 TaxID=2819130 RepID=UPI001BE65A6B|nr:IucA/IucC family C-terminal-domain containing protein [Bacillus sp. ISL-47]MBT2687514.1 (2Fe-2S)-binding protein [Bacillus sp. ISL-47]MBT2706490.1 (2Fe-2S)-binding protein [Pseudomonas sp. ISL-84]